MDNMVGVEEAISIASDDFVLPFILSLGEAIGSEASEGFGLALTIGHV